MTKRRATIDNLATNTPEIDLFKQKRHAYNDNGIVWTSYCKVDFQVGGGTISDTLEVKIRRSGGSYTTIALSEGFNITESTVGSTIFSAKLARITYEAESLIIEGTGPHGYYKVVIGEYDSAYVSKYVD